MKITEIGTLAPQNHGKLVIVEGTYLAATLSIERGLGTKICEIGSIVTMPKAPRDKENTTPKKRTRKAAANGEMGFIRKTGAALKSRRSWRRPRKMLAKLRPRQR